MRAALVFLVALTVSAVSLSVGLLVASSSPAMRDALFPALLMTPVR